MRIVILNRINIGVTRRHEFRQTGNMSGAHVVDVDLIATSLVRMNK